MSTPRPTLTNGDRDWSEAGSTTLADLSDKVRKHAKDLRGDLEVEAVHDMRTTTRRLRTAITVFGDEADKGDRKRVEQELRRVARELGAVRDLDVLLATLPDSGLEPLRKAWTKERERNAGRLKTELGRPRLRRALSGAKGLVHAPDGDGAGVRDETVLPRVASRAPALIWDAMCSVLAHELDPLTADPTAIHAMRKDAKKLRYTLEAFEDALEPSGPLIEQVMALADAGGEMHDAIVARDRARTAVADLHLDGDDDAAAVEAYATSQDDRAQSRRPVVASAMKAVRSRAYRESLGRALAGMGHVQPEG